jgi:hypothetical protein
MSFADTSTLGTGPTFLRKSKRWRAASSLSHETGAHTRRVLVVACLLALRNTHLPIAHERNALFFALGPHRFATAGARRTRWLRRIVRRFFWSGCTRIHHEKHGRRSKRSRWLRNGFRRVRLIRSEHFRRTVVEPFTKLPHAQFGVFDAISSLSKRIKLQPLAPTRRTNGRFDRTSIIKRHAVFEAHIAFVERMDTRPARRKSGQCQRSQCKTHRPR